MNLIKKCNPGFYPKRTCIVINRFFHDKDIKRECYPIHQEFKKSKNVEDFKKFVATKKSKSMKEILKQI